MAATDLTIEQIQVRVANLPRAISLDAYRRIWPGVAQMAVSDVKKNFAESHTPAGVPWRPLAHGRPGQAAGGRPLRDTGLLMNSITGKPDESGVTVGTNLNYAALMNFGTVKGPLRPKRGKFLAIPLTKEAKRYGSPRNYPAVPKFRFIPTRTGGFLMVAPKPMTNRQSIAIDLRRIAGQKLTAKQKALMQGVPQYLLVRQVTVPARQFLGFSAGLLTRVGRLITDVTSDELGKALSGA